MANQFGGLYEDDGTRCGTYLIPEEGPATILIRGTAFTPLHTESVHRNGQTLFCAGCGTFLNGSERYCPMCGAELEYGDD